jgi:hypothetical protein
MAAAISRAWGRRGLLALAAIGAGAVLAASPGGTERSRAPIVLLFTLAVLAGVAKTGTA